MIFQMSVALFLTGWWMYVDVPQTPQAVVICVIVYNAFFGYRYSNPYVIDYLMLITRFQLGTYTLVIPS